MVLASTVVGAFAVNFKKVNATPSQLTFTWSDLADLAYDVYPNNEVVESWFDFFSGSGSVNNALDFDIFNNNSWLVIAALGSEPSEIAISVWEWTGSNASHSDGWSVRNNTFIMLNSNSSGYVYHLRGYFFSSLGGYHCDKSRVDIAYYNVTSSSPANDIFSWSPAQANQRYWTLMPNVYNITNANWTWLTSRPIYNTNSSVINYPQTLVGAPVSAYNNVCFSLGNNYYFTFSDQSILLDFISDSAGLNVPITFQKGGRNSTYIYNTDELVYTGRTSISGVTNVGAGGVIAWNITPLINQWYFDSVVASHVEPSDVYGNYFAYNEAIISWTPATDPSAQYEYYLQQFLDSIGSSYDVVPDDVPDYVSNQVNTNFPGNVTIKKAGTNVGFVNLNEMPDVPFDQVLVISEKAFDVLIISLFGQVTIQEDVFKLNYLQVLLEQCDLICVISQSDFDDIIEEGYDDYPDHFRFFSPNQWSWGNFTFNHGLWYMTSVTSVGRNEFDVDCVSIVTQRYLQHVNNWILSDGVKFLYNALNAISSNQTDAFNSITSGIASVIYSVDTLGGKLDALNRTISFDVINRLDSIVDKLESIVYNTDEQEHGFWILSIYNFISQFVPSMEGFSNWIDAIEDFSENAPPLPVVTVPALPTIT